MVLVFGLSASLLDCGTDLNFAWSAEADCGGVAKCNVQRFDLDQLSTPCGMFGYKMVERTTYAIISFPGFFLAFSTLRGLFAFLINRFWGENIPGRVLRLSRVFAHMLEVSLFLLLFLGNRWSETLLCQRPDFVPLFDGILQGMAYISVSLTVAVRLFGTFCHGPESRRLVAWAKEKETKFEAAFQLVLVSSIYFSSGITTTAGGLSATTSVFFISINGVETFLQRHEKKLEDVPSLGKICVAVSVLPAFLLATVFKIGASACGQAWDSDNVLVIILIGFGIPNVLIVVLKMFGQLKDFGSITEVFQWILFDFLTLHLWPKGPTGKKIGLAMAFFTFLLFPSPGLFLVANPEPTPSTRWTVEKSNNTEYLKWALDTEHRLQVASHSLLMVGSIALALAIFIILFEDQWVANIVSKFEICADQDTVPKIESHAKKENDVNEELASTEYKNDCEESIPNEV